MYVADGSLISFFNFDGSTKIKCFSVMILDDSFAKANETFNYTLIADDVAIYRSTVSVTVLGNDGKFSSFKLYLSYSLHRKCGSWVYS